MVGQHAATTRRVRYKLLPEVSEDLDVAVLAGVNDVLSRRSPQDWRTDLTAIVDGLAERAEQVAVAGMPAFRQFPNLPTTLGRYLAQRAQALDEVSRQVCAEHPRATWIGSTDALFADPDFFSQDRFHPSATGYRRFAQAVAEYLKL